MGDRYTDLEVFGADEFGGVFDGIGKAVTGVAKSVGKAAKGAVKATGSAGSAVGLLAQGKVAKAGKQVVKAGKQAASAVTKVTDNKILQAGWPGSLITSNIALHAAKGGPKAAISAAKRTAQNPLIKAEVAAASLIFPPIAPLSAGAIAATEAAARTHEALKSGDPKKIAQAAITVAATTAMAAKGNTGAMRGLQALNKVGGGLNLVSDLKKGLPAAKKVAAKVTQKGGADKQLAQLLTARDALKNQKHRDPKVRAKAQATLSTIQRTAPGLLEGVQAAMKVPERVKLGRFAVLRTGRILLDGKPIRKIAASLPVRARR